MQNNLFTRFPEDSPTWLSNFVDIYQKLTTNNLELLANIYHTDVTFIDPLHHLEGIDNLYQYFDRLYQNLFTCKFSIDNVIFNGDEAAIYWTMTYQHNKLNSGKRVTVYGSSHIKGYGGKVIYHRDYLDLGSMIYEHIPLFGQLVKWVKTKVGS